ncbi:class I adenylate-forming enzyme family protein [Streptomyces sp. 900105755]
MAGIADVVLERAGDDRAAIMSERGTTSYKDLADLTARLAGGLARRIRAEDDVCLVVSHPQLEESLALALAGWSLGMRVAVLPPYLKESELAWALGKCSPVVTVSDTTGDSPRSFAFSGLLQGKRARPFEARPGGRLETFTSGTTGRPKCVDRSADRLGQDIAQLASAIGLAPDDRVTAMTTALSTTSVLPALHAGATVVTVALQTPRQFWQTVADQRITVLSGTPYAYELAARRCPDPGLIPDVRLALTTSARLRPRTIDTLLKQTGIAVRNVMCSSESGHIAYNRTDDPTLLAESVGTPLPGVEVEIRSEDGTAVPTGQEGRICVRSPFTASGYRHDPDETAPVFQDGWVVSTDVGYRDEAGYLHLTGRDDHRIHFGAAKLDPQEIEDTLLRHPAVEDALVVGEEHIRLGQIPVARVVVSAGAPAEELLQHCRDRLSATKVPQRIDFVTEIPKDFKGQPVRPRYFRFA